MWPQDYTTTVAQLVLRGVLSDPPVVQVGPAGCIIAAKRTQQNRKGRRQEVVISL